MARVIFEASALGRTARVEVRGQNGRYTVIVDGTPHEVDIRPSGRSFWSLLMGGRSHVAGLEKAGGAWRVALREGVIDVELAEVAKGGTVTPRKAPSGPTVVMAPMPGKVVRVLVEAGGTVRAGQGLVIVEAMKMENEIRAPRDGVVREVAVREQQAVETGAALVQLL